MSYHYTSSGTSSSAARSTTNTQGQAAPEGYHYMPDGTLMSDVEHAALYGSGQNNVIEAFNLDLSDIPAAGAIRDFNILGTNNSRFSLEVKNTSNNYYYNFTTKLFQEGEAKLYNKQIGNGYSNSVTFPSIVTTDTVNGAVSSGVKVVMDTVVANTMAVGDRVTGNTVLNSTIVTVAALDPDGDNTSEFSLSSAVALDDGITLSFTGGDQYDFYLFAQPGTDHVPYSKVKFADESVDINSSSGSNSLLLKKVIYQYSSSLLTMSTISAGGSISFTNTSDTIDIFRGKSGAKSAFSITATSASTKSFQITKQPTPNDVLVYLFPTVGSSPEDLPGEDIYPALTSTDTVDGSVTSGVKIVMDNNVADRMAVGDRITGNTALDARVVTVVALNPDEDNVKEFSMSEAVDVADGIRLSFFNQMNYQWPLDNIDNITEGMIVANSTNVTTDTTIGTYEDSTTILDNTDKKRKIVRYRSEATNTKSQKPTIEKGLVTTQLGNVIFDKQQVLALAGDAMKIGGYGTSKILSVTGYELLFSDLEVALTSITTTTTAASTASTSVVVAARDGILNTVSTVSGVGINASAAAPTVNSGASASGAGTIVLSAAQSLESGVTLTFPGAGKVITITGKVEVLKAGVGNPTLRFDIDKLVTST